MNWSFTNPLMLAGLAAVGLPLFIHWLTRARSRRIAFPPYKFLVEACAGQQAVNRLRTILLLLVRCLLVAVLALLFARPFLKPAGRPQAADQTRRVVLLLDASLSMRAAPQGVSLFARAQAEAAEVLRGLPAGSEAAVILAGAAPRALLPALSENIPALHDLLVQSRPTYDYGDPAAALALAQKLLNGSGTIHVFSDFQKSNWEAVRELPGDVSCRLRSVASAALDNLALTGARMTPAAPVVGEPVEVSGTVFNCSPRPRQVTVRLELGEFTRETSLTLQPFSSAAATFNLEFPRAGGFAGRLQLPPDSLAEDNTRFLAATIGQALQLVVVSDADESDWHRPAYYISRALAPSPQAAPGLRLVQRRGQDLDRGILETADVFCLAAPVTLSGEAVEIITRRVNEGARVISFLDGPNARALMLPGLNPPFQLLEPVASAAGDPVQLTAQKWFGELEATDFAAQRFHRHLKNLPAAGRAADILLSYADGSAALSISPTGRGALVLVNLPLTPDGGDFVGHPVFPAMMHELLRALRRDVAENTVTPGTPRMLDVPTPGNGTLSVTGPGGATVESRVLASGRTTRLALSASSLPGIYTIKQAGTVVMQDVVNVDPRESDLRPIALESLKSGPSSSVVVQQEAAEASIIENQHDLWPLLAALVAVFLAVEMILLALWRKTRTPGRFREVVS